MPKTPPPSHLPADAAAEIEALKAKRAEAAKHLLRLKAAEGSYEGFIRLLHPDWTLEPFQLKLIKALDLLEKGLLTRAFLDERAPTRGERPIDNVLITMPPRHAKTTFATIHFPPYYLARNPRRYVMSCSYNAQLAADFGRQARDISDERAVQQAFPDFRLANDSRAADVWRTESGGAYFGVGIGGTTSGRPSTCFVAGTLVATPTGETAIERLRPGDAVLSLSLTTGLIETKRVVATQRTLAPATISLRTPEGRTLRATPDHPIFSARTNRFEPAAAFLNGHETMRTLRQQLRLEAEPAPPLLLTRLLRFGDHRLARLQRLFRRLLPPARRHGKAWQTPQILLPGLHGSRTQEARLAGVSALPDHLPPQTEPRASCDPLLSGLRRGGETKARRLGPLEALLRAMRRALHSTEREVALLLKGLRWPGPLTPHLWPLQPALPARRSLLPLQPRLAAHLGYDPRTRRLHLRELLRDGAEPRRPSHRHGQEEQRAGEPDLALPTLPHQHPQDARHGGRHGTNLSAPCHISVFDIQVEDNHNFFAEGVLVHNCLIIDDPLKSREDADSATMRNKVWSYYTSALSVRLQPEDGGARPKQIIIQTRWHPDDLAGRLQQTADWQEGRWGHLDMPAIIREERTRKVSVRELPPDHPRYNPLPASYIASDMRYVPVTETHERALWPSRFPLDDLKRKERLNPREFASLYMQRPYIEGGNLIRANWWRYYASDLKPENFACLIITADTAFKARESSDYSVLLTAGLSHDGDIYIVDVTRGRWEFPDLKQRLIAANTRWRGKGLRAIYIEDKASGQSLIQELRRESGMAIIPYKVTYDKVARVNAVTPLIEGGRVYLPEEAPWLDDFMTEAQQFPGSTHDDQVDALSMALDVLSRQTVGLEALDTDLDPTGSLHQVASRPDHPLRVNSLRTRFKLPSFKGWGV